VTPICKRPASWCEDKPKDQDFELPRRRLLARKDTNEKKLDPSDIEYDDGTQAGADVSISTEALEPGPPQPIIASVSKMPVVLDGEEDPEATILDIPVNQNNNQNNNPQQIPKRGDVNAPSFGQASVNSDGSSFPSTPSPSSPPSNSTLAPEVKVYAMADCDEDGILDHVCYDGLGHRGVIGSGSSCIDNWPNAPVADCPAIFGPIGDITTLKTDVNALKGGAKPPSSTPSVMPYAILPVVQRPAPMPLTVEPEMAPMKPPIIGIPIPFVAQAVPL